MKKLLHYVSAIPVAILFCLALVATSCQKEETGQSPTLPVANDEVPELQVRTEAQHYQGLLPEQVQKQAADIRQELQQLHAAGKTSSNITIYRLTGSLPLFSTLTAAIKVTGLNSLLDNPKNNLTLFAPTDLAFAVLPAPFNNAHNISGITDTAQLAILKAILLYHMLNKALVYKEMIAGRSQVSTLKPKSSSNNNDNVLYLSKNAGHTSINGKAMIAVPDIVAQNGVVQAVSSLLAFPTNTIAAAVLINPNLSTLMAALVKTHLADSLAIAGDYTLFAPTNYAFAKLPAPFNNAGNINSISNTDQLVTLSKLLKQHLLSGRYFGSDLGIFAEHTTLAAGSQLITAATQPVGYVKGSGNRGYNYISPGNILCTNGVIHVIPNLLKP